jgi:hypothetical protein
VPPEPLPFETLHEGLAIRFLGSVYATAQSLPPADMTSEVGQGSRSSERMGGYDQFISLLFFILQIIYVHTCCFIYSHKFIQSVLSYYNMLYLSVLILQSSCLYCYLFISSYFVIIHEPCLYAYYIYSIHMLYVLLIHTGMNQFEITISMVNYLLYVIIIMLIYGIKIIRKMPIFLTNGAGCWRRVPVRGGRGRADGKLAGAGCWSFADHEGEEAGWMDGSRWRLFTRGGAGVDWVGWHRVGAEERGMVYTIVLIYSRDSVVLVPHFGLRQRCGGRQRLKRDNQASDVLGPHELLRLGRGDS